MTRFRSFPELQLTNKFAIFFLLDFLVAGLEWPIDGQNLIIFG
jgi:hypothetical protein